VGSIEERWVDAAVRERASSVALFPTGVRTGSLDMPSGNPEICEAPKPQALDNTARTRFAVVGWSRPILRWSRFTSAFVRASAFVVPIAGTMIFRT